jgi:hypothetical protein
VGLIVVFDFLSHETMHLPFNEGYLRTLRAAYPHDEIVFHACAGHVANLSACFAPSDRISFQPVERFQAAFGLSRHNPLGGRIGAWRCWRAINAALAGRTPRLAAVLGVEANLLGVLRRVWPASVPLHLILHNHIAETVRWRSRNPVLRNFDLTAGLQSRLPPHIRLIALELGISEALAAYAPAMAGSIDELEHPILGGEWGETRTLAPDEPLRIGFLGHASASKGFDRFVAWATAHAGPRLEFHAIGIASPEALRMDQSALTRPATAGSVPRSEYVAALAPCHLVCLPLSPTYDFVASGSVIDAIAGLKPILGVRNNSFAAMEAKYGEFGSIAPDDAALDRLMATLDRAWVLANQPMWDASLRRIRAARLPENLALGYRALLVL